MGTAFRRADTALAAFLATLPRGTQNETHFNEALPAILGRYRISGATVEKTFGIDWLPANHEASEHEQFDAIRIRFRSVFRHVPAQESGVAGRRSLVR